MRVNIASWANLNDETVSMIRVMAAILLLAAAFPLASCVVYPARPGWCYYHPHRCR